MKHPVQAVGLGLCELVDPAGRVLSRNCLPWDGSELQQRLAPWGPVVLEADVRAAARAEALYGGGQSFHIFLYITVGTGIASSLVIDGTPYLGARGATGTMASSPISVPCPRCGHVNDRSLEEIASGPALVARYNERKPGGAQTGPDVFAAAAQGDQDALEVVESAGQSLEAMVGLLVNVLDPEAVIVGGGLGLSEGPYWDSFIAATRRHIWSEVHRDLPILRATTGTRAGLLGAAATAWLKHGS
jgi:glucokinase